MFTGATVSPWQRQSAPLLALALESTFRLTPPPPQRKQFSYMFYSSSLKELLTTAQKVGRNMIGLTRVMIQCLTRLGGCEAEGRGEGRGEERGEERGEGRGDVGRGR